MNKYQEKIAEKVLETIKDIESTNDTEMIEKTDFAMKFYQIVSNYDELEPVIAKTLNEKARKDKWER